MICSDLDYRVVFESAGLDPVEIISEISKIRDPLLDGIRKVRLSLDPTPVRLEAR